MFRGPVYDWYGSRRLYRRGQLVEAALLGASPGLLQPVGGRCGGTYKILHAHDNDGRLTATVDNKALVVFGGEIHDLAELGSGDMGVDAAIHRETI
jgi:hypothetical protein